MGARSIGPRVSRHRSRLPLRLLESPRARETATRVQLKRAQDWLASDARQLMADAAIFAGAYMTISGLVRLL